MDLDKRYPRMVTDEPIGDLSIWTTSLHVQHEPVSLLALPKSSVSHLRLTNIERLHDDGKGLFHKIKRLDLASTRVSSLIDWYDMCNIFGSSLQRLRLTHMLLMLPVKVTGAWTALTRLTVTSCAITMEALQLLHHSPLTHVTWLNVRGHGAHGALMGTPMPPPVNPLTIRVLKTNNWHWKQTDDDEWNTSTLEHLTLVLAPKDVFLRTIPHPKTTRAIKDLRNSDVAPGLQTITWKFTTPVPWMSYTKDTILEFLEELRDYRCPNRLIFRGRVKNGVFYHGSDGWFCIDEIVVQFLHGNVTGPFMQFDYSIEGGDGRRFITDREHGKPPQGDKREKGTWMIHHGWAR
jgi:hypothetical protein